MTEFGASLIFNTVQCWSCPIFDRMFQIISEAASAAYPIFVGICVMLFMVVFAFYVFGAVWKNMSTGFNKGWFDKSLRPVFINALFALTFLGMGVMLPRFITTITFEPVAYVTQSYAGTMLKMTPTEIDERVVYQGPDIDDENKIFRQELRDAIIGTAKVTITMFQSFMQLGIAMLDEGFSWDMFLGVGAFVKHIILAFVGLYLFWMFMKMFFKFLCYFADVIIAMAMFAFFFPLSIMTATFKEAADVPYWLSWIKNLGKGVGVEQIKNVISSIISLGVAVITYTVILVIMVKFFSDGSVNHFDELMSAITSGRVFEMDLETSGLNDLTITSVVVLVYVLGFIYDKIPDITKMILGMFEVSADKNDVGKEIGDSIMKFTKGVIDTTKEKVKTIVNHGQP